MSKRCPYIYLAGMRFKAANVRVYLELSDGRTSLVPITLSGNYDDTSEVVSLSVLRRLFGDSAVLRAEVVTGDGADISGLLIDLAKCTGRKGRRNFSQLSPNSFGSPENLKVLAREQLRTLPDGKGDRKAVAARLHWLLRTLPDGHVGAVFASGSSPCLVDWLELVDLHTFVHTRPADAALIHRTLTAQPHSEGSPAHELIDFLESCRGDWEPHAATGIARALRHDPALLDVSGPGADLLEEFAPAMTRLHRLRAEGYASKSPAPLVIVDDRATLFEKSLRSGDAPQPSGWTERAQTAGLDATGKFCGDEHALVRAASTHSAPLERVRRMLLEDPDPVVVRAAAHRIAADVGHPLITEGRISEVTTPAAAPPDVIFVDVDGTLVDGVAVRDSESIVALMQAQARGVLVVAITGRSVAALGQTGFRPDVAVCGGELVDLSASVSLGRVSDKGEAVRTVMDLYACRVPAAIGDGTIDVPMFEAVRERGGRCAWVASGQDAPAKIATDVVGPVGSGGVGRFVTDLCNGNERTPVPPLVPISSVKTSVYAAQVLPQETFTSLCTDEMLPSGWKAAHGHITLAFPSKVPGEHRPLPIPERGVHVEIYGKVVTDSVTAYAVRLGDITHQPDGTPLHVTVGLAPNEKGFTAPYLAGPAVAKALSEGTIELLEHTIRVPVLASPAGSPEARLPQELEVRAAENGVELWVAHRAVRAGLAHLASEISPVQSCVEAGALPTRGLVVLVGPPASGKSTAAEAIVASAPNTVLVSLDAIRGEINGDPASQDKLRDVVTLAEARMRTELALGRLVVCDATNLEEHVLREHVARVHAVGLPAVALYADISQEEATNRDRLRHEQGERSIGCIGDAWDAQKAKKIFTTMYTRWDSVAEGLIDGTGFGFDAVAPLTSFLKSSN